MSPQPRHIAHRPLVNELVTPRFGRKIKLQNHRLKTAARKA
jgi:hypothetical protein